MPKSRPLQQSFSAGELSPRLLARSDVEGYRASALEMTNFISTPHGPAARRFGFEKILWDEAGEYGQYGRLFDFNVSYSRAYVVVVTPAWVVIVDRNGVIDQGNPIANPNFTDGGTDWSIIDGGNGAVVFSSGVCMMDGGTNANQTQTITQQVTIDDGTVENEMLINSLSDGRARFMVGTTPGGDDIFSQDFTGRRARIAFTPGVNTFYISIYVQGDWPIKTLDSLRIRDPEVPADFVQFPSPWVTPAQIEGIQVDMPPNEDIMYLVSRDVPPFKLSREEADIVPFDAIWSLEQVEFATDDDPDDPGEPLPPPWGADPPGSIAFHQGRMWLGGTRTLPSNVWGSKPGDYESLEFGDGDQDDDALEFELRHRGDIQWMRGAKDLHIGTGRNEILLVSDGAIITPQDSDARQQSVYGSARVHGIPVADGIAWMNPNGRKMYVAAYSDERQGYQGLDITYPSEHITEGRVSEIEHTISPDTMLITPKLNGDMAIMTYEPSRQIAGWHRHQTDGRILSVCVTEELGVSKIYWLVLREVDGEQRLILERADSDTYMDSYVRQVFVDPVSVVDNLAHLEGKTVQILVDNAVQSDQVVENGQVTLDRPGKDILVGLQYVSTLRTLPLEVLTQAESQASKQKRFNRIFVRLLNSARPKVNGENPRKRTPATPMGEREPDRTEDILVHDLGWDRVGSIVVEMELPFACNVLGIFGEVGIEGL